MKDEEQEQDDHKDVELGPRLCDAIGGGAHGGLELLGRLRKAFCGHRPTHSALNGVPDLLDLIDILLEEGDLFGQVLDLGLTQPATTTTATAAGTLHRGGAAVRLPLLQRVTLPINWCAI